MTTYNTGNPIGSTDARDLYDNAQNLDNFVNGTAASYTDRLGVSRRSLAGIDSAADNVLNSIGYAVPVAYASGISLTLTSQTVEYNGVVYAPKSSALPFTTSSWGADSAKFRAVQVADAAYMSYTPAGTGAVATTVQQQLRNIQEWSVNVKDAPFYAKGDGVTDDTAAIQAAINAIKKTGNLSRAGAPNLFFPFGTYLCNSTLNIDGGHVRLVGENSTIKYSGSGNAVFIGASSYLTDLNAGYFYAGFSNIAIQCTNSSAKCVVNSGYRKIEFVNSYLVGGAIGLETEGAWAGGLFYESVCQSQSSHGINLKQRNNLFVFEKSRVLGAGGNGIIMSTAGAELKGIKLKDFDFEGCVGAINITGNVGNVMISGCWFENNSVYNIRIDNTAGTNNKFATTIHNCQITGAGVDVLIGTDTAGTLIEGVSVFDNEFADSDLVVIGNGKVSNFREWGNRFSATGTKTLPTSGLQTTAAGLMPQFSVAPTEPYGYNAVGQQGEIRYSATSGRVWMKTNSGGGAGGWLLMQGQVVGDYSYDIATLPTGTTPSVLQRRACRTNNGSATNITSLADGFVTQELIIYGLDGGNTTIVHGTNIRLAGGVNFTLGDNDSIHLLCVNGTKWVEIARSNNA